MLKSTRQTSDGKKCAGTSISWAQLYRKSCQENAKVYFNFNSKPLVGVLLSQGFPLWENARMTECLHQSPPSPNFYSLPIVLPTNRVAQGGSGWLSVNDCSC